MSRFRAYLRAQFLGSRRLSGALVVGIAAIVGNTVADASKVLLGEKDPPLSVVLVEIAFIVVLIILSWPVGRFEKNHLGRGFVLTFGTWQNAQHEQAVRYMSTTCPVCVDVEVPVSGPDESSMTMVSRVAASILDNDLTSNLSPAPRKVVLNTTLPHALQVGRAIRSVGGEVVLFAVTADRLDYFEATRLPPPRITQSSTAWQPVTSCGVTSPQSELIVGIRLTDATLAAPGTTSGFVDDVSSYATSRSVPCVVFDRVLKAHEQRRECVERLVSELADWLERQHVARVVLCLRTPVFFAAALGSRLPAGQALYVAPWTPAGGYLLPLVLRDGAL